MNRCCNQLLVKNLINLHNLNASIKNYHAISTIIKYSFLDKPKMLLCPSKLNDFDQNRNLAREPPQKIQKNENKKKKKPVTNDKMSSDDIFKPLEVKPLTGLNENIGLELGGKLEKSEINKVLVNFRQDENVLVLAKESGLNSRMFNDVLLSFRRFCLQSKTLPPDLHIKLSDIILKAAKHTDLFPYFLRHAHELFPHLHCMDDLKHISDLTEPSYWYIEARDMKRKIIYHAGPTNSGKTYSALKRFQESSNGIYCGPLKLLANEVFIKSNSAGLKCDLITGEERRFGDESGKPSEHMACTVEMVNLEKTYEVAVIDEIQMIKDQQRGWAWTRALLGIKANEIHVCGDLTASDLISDLSFLTGDDFELKTYERLTSLAIMDKPLESYDNVEPGDCFVCFNKNDIYNVLNNLEVRGHEVAVIYGSMPPGVKLNQAARFNDPNDKCKILVATDAIGMGLNLNIRRIIFYSLRKVQQKESKHDADGKDASEIENITTSQALQIAGRAGRFNTAFKDGLVTTFTKQDLPILKEILSQPLEKTTRAGLHPTAEQIELFAYHLPNHSLSDLIKIFMSICRIDSGQYFLCNFGEIAYLAEMIDHIPINLRSKYTFATSPINRKQTFVCSCFVKFVRYYSNNEVVSDEILKKMIEWPFKIPQNVNEVAHLETVYDVLDLYLWLAYRFPDIFTYIDEVKQMRIELEQIIYEGVKNISILNQSGNKTRHLISRRHKRIEAQNLSQINIMFTSNQILPSKDKDIKMSKIDLADSAKIQPDNESQKYDCNFSSSNFQDKKIDESKLKSKYQRLVDYLNSKSSAEKKNEPNHSKVPKITDSSNIDKSGKLLKESYKSLIEDGTIELSLKKIKNFETKNLSFDNPVDSSNVGMAIKKIFKTKKKN